MLNFYLGANLTDPSSLIVSPFNKTLVKILSTNIAYSNGVPRRFGKNNAAKMIATNDVLAFKIDANPPVVVCCPKVMNKKGKILFNKLMIKRLKKVLKFN